MGILERSRNDIQNIFLNEYNDPVDLVKDEHIISKFLQTVEDDELELFIKIIDETQANLKVKKFNPQNLTTPLRIEIPQGYKADVVKKLIYASDRLGKLIFEARIDIKRYTRVLFTFDDDNYCETTIYTFGYEKTIGQKDIYTDTYSLTTRSVHNQYIKNKLHEGIDYYEGQFLNEPIEEQT